MGGKELPDFNTDRAELFEALGHPTRIRILQAPDGQPLGFADLRRKMGIESNGLLSFHLGKLDGLVRLTQEGSYAITDEGREALRVVSTASFREKAGSKFGAVRQSFMGKEDSAVIVARRRRELAIMTILVVLFVVGVVALFFSSTARYAEVPGREYSGKPGAHSVQGSLRRIGLCYPYECSPVLHLNFFLHVIRRMRHMA